MTKFEVLQRISGIKEFAELMFEMAHKVNSAEELEKELSSTIPEEGLQTLKSVAQRGNYPLSLDALQ